MISESQKQQIWDLYKANKEKALEVIARIESNPPSGIAEEDWDTLKSLGASNELLLKLALGWEPPTVTDPPPETSEDPLPPIPRKPGKNDSSSQYPLKAIDLNKWDVYDVAAGDRHDKIHLFNSDHIAVHHGVKDGILDDAIISNSHVSNCKMWAGRVYRLAELRYDNVTIWGIEREHGLYGNMAGGLFHDPENEVAVHIDRCLFENIGGQGYQFVLEEVGNDTPWAPNPFLRINETPDWEEDVQPGGWIICDNSIFRYTAQHSSRGSFCLSHFRTRNHVAIRGCKIDNRYYANGNVRDVCRGHILVQGVQEYKDALGKTRPQWDRHVVIEDNEFFGNDFNQPLFLLEKGLADIRIRRNESYSTGGQDFLRVNLKPGGNLTIEDWYGPGKLELNGKLVANLEDGFQS